MDAILQDHLPVTPWAEERLRRLPGIQPMEAGDWLRVDEAYAGQMALRERLLNGEREAVLRIADRARPAAEELLREALAAAGPLGFEVSHDAVRRPDGKSVRVDREDPLGTLGRLFQEDFCLMEKEGEAHVLTGAVLCFPASWSLAEKFLRPLIGIHEPVERYDDDVARRVQRLFDNVRVGQGLWRANALLYDDPALFQPRREDGRRKRPGRGAPYLRSERQTITRLPQTGAVVFAIHTYVVRQESLTAAQRASLLDVPIEHVADV